MAGILIPLLVLAAFVAAVPAVPVPETHIVHFPMASSGDLKPNSYIYASVSAAAGSDLLARWNSSTDLTGYFYTPDQFNNFRNTLAGTPSGTAEPLNVATSANGDLFVQSISADTTVYFVLWNRHNTDATFSGVNPFAIWTAGQCSFTVLDYLLGSHDCFAPSSSAITTSPASSSSSYSSSSNSSSQISTAATTTITNALTMVVNNEYYVRLNTTNYYYFFNVTITNSQKSWNVSLPNTHETFEPAFVYRSPGVPPICAGLFSLKTGDGSQVCLSTAASFYSSNLRLSSFGALPPGESIVILMGFITTQLITPQNLQYSCVSQPSSPSPISCGNYLQAPTSLSLSASVSTFPSQPTAVSVLAGQSQLTFQTSNGGQVGVGSQEQTGQDKIGDELANSIAGFRNSLSACPGSCTIVYSGQLVEFTATVGCQGCVDKKSPTGQSFQVTSLLTTVNPDFSVVSTSRWCQGGFGGFCFSPPNLPFCESESIAGPWPVEVMVSPKLYGSVAVPYVLQFDASVVSPCP